MIGQRISHYTILEKLGAGGMGVVYRARDERLGREVALKVLPPAKQEDEAARSRLVNEARTASSLNHSNIAVIFEVGEAEGQTHIAMEFVPGRTLSAMIPPGGLPTETVLEIGKQLADALAHAHQHHILHHDLKSSNVVITPEGRAKVLDFGLARHVLPKELAATTQSMLSFAGGVKMAGTLPYMAPEVLRGEPADARSDLWGLGVVLYEMAKGELPFQGRTGLELTTSIMRESAAPLPERVSPGVRAIITRCLAKTPGSRYQQASEVRAALEALISTSAVAGPIGTAGVSRRMWIWTLAGAVALGAIATVVVLSLRNRGESAVVPGAGGRLTLLLSSEAEADYPEISPDGKMIAYVAEDQGWHDLFVSRVAGGVRVRLTNDTSRESSPAFSPDGERIAFSRPRPDTGEPEICVAPTLGGKAVPLVAGGRFPAWSADGKRLAFTVRRAGQPDALGTSAVDGSDLRVLLRADANYPFLLSPAWSPDGKTIVFGRSPGGIRRSLWLIPAEGGEVKRLGEEQSGVFDKEPKFTPDGRGVIYVSNRAGATNLWMMPLHGKAPVRLTTGAGPDASPSVARDGTIVYSNTRSRTALLVYRLKDAQTRTVLSHSSSLWAPAFSPDGREIAYSRAEADGSWHIWVTPVEGGTARQLTAGELPQIYPRYMPDGRWVTYFTWGPKPHRVWRVPSSGGPAAALTPERDSNDAHGDVSPDGKWLAFSRSEGSVVLVYVMPLEGGPARRLTEAPSTVPRWSPDGQWIAYSPERTFTSGIYVVRADGTGVRKLADTGSWPVWWPDGKQIGYQAVGPDGSEQIRVVPFAGGESKTLTRLPFHGTNYPFDVSRDGVWLVTTNEVSVQSEIWMLKK